MSEGGEHNFKLESRSWWEVSNVRQIQCRI